MGEGVTYEVDKFWHLDLVKPSSLLVRSKATGITNGKCVGSYHRQNLVLAFCRSKSSLPLTVTFLAPSTPVELIFIPETSSNLT